jgi:hypothetical protein
MEEFDGMIMDETGWMILEELRRKALNSRWWSLQVLDWDDFPWVSNNCSVHIWTVKEEC